MNSTVSSLEKRNDYNHFLPHPREFTPLSVFDCSSLESELIFNCMKEKKKKKYIYIYIYKHIYKIYIIYTVNGYLTDEIGFIIYGKIRKKYKPQFSSTHLGLLFPFTVHSAPPLTRFP